jgi:methylisocitrate lyase
MGAVEAGLHAIATAGTQEPLVPRMQTRGRLYDLIGYSDYRAFDAGVADFTIPGGGAR